MSRILWRLGCDVRVYDPSGLPVNDDVQHTHPKVEELRDLSRWSDGHFWVSPDQHGNLVQAAPNFPILAFYVIQRPSANTTVLSRRLYSRTR